MAKWGVLNDGEVLDVFVAEHEAVSYAEVYGGETAELVENLWWIESDWSENGNNYITVERNAAAFCKVLDLIGLKPGKLAEILGKTPQTIRMYRSGQRTIPKLVIEKVQELDRVINGGE